ncbi:autophagy-related protein 27 [Cantharellus anzutake]|uniref:autophagy-related protein 27 n=1 Tax=Cantharellus anzutake TaxID=1750568 RepID=UPI0019077FA0|nr:autophagy-related protein 27 [Cantharellus anzutake]KAF8326677.1 autophagy-related protein 27 [Cantharellus anzutake]
MLRSFKLASTLLLLSWLDIAKADDSWECAFTLDSKHHYDLKSLSGERKIQKTWLSPPTKNTDTLRFDLCQPIKEDTSVPEDDRCPSSTYACWTTANEKSGKTRITQVISLARSPSLSPEYKRLSDSEISVTLHGDSWPEPTSPRERFVVTLQCSSSDEDPELGIHTENATEVHWKVKAACAEESKPPPPDTKHPDEDSRKTSEGSSLGWFFFLLLFCFATYLGLGAYYNYNNYGASGWDLVPHRDFWRDVPHLLSDLLRGILSGVRGNNRVGNRSGYVSV